MIATLYLLCFFILYIGTFVFSPPIIIIILILLVQGAFLIVYKYEKGLLFAFLMAQMILFVPFVITKEIDISQKIRMYKRGSEIEGRALFDSTLSESGNSVVTLQVKKMVSSHKTEVYINKPITTIIQSDDLIYAHSYLRVDGSFFITEDGTTLFMGSSYIVEDKNLFIAHREKIINYIRDRVDQLSDKNRDLVLLITLGLKGKRAPYITQRAVEKGIAHLFALSGMHLSVLLSLFTRVLASLVSKRKNRLIAIALALIYLYIAGNKPSLVRTLLFLILTPIFSIQTPFDKFMSAIILHSLLLPSSMMTLASLYSYTALYSIIALTPCIMSILEPYIVSILASSFAITVSAMSLTSIVSLLMFHSFTPLGILYTIISTPIILLLLIVSFIYILIPHKGVLIGLEWIGNFTFKLLEKEIQTYFTLSPFILYGLFMSFILTLFLVLWYCQKQKQARSHRLYEMENSLRINQPDKKSP